MKSSPHGFSLVELLVVIFIISLLSAISMSAMTRSLRAGDRVVCLSNQRQLYYGWMMYASGHDGKLVSSDTQFNTGTEHNNWVCDGPVPVILPKPDRNEIAQTEKSLKGGNGLVIYLGVQVDANTNCGTLWPYIRDVRLFKCPSARYFRGYSISAAMHGDSTSYSKFEQIKSPESKAVLIDGAPQRAWLDGPFTTAYLQLSGRHEKGCNAIFADGHAQYRKWSDPRTMEFINGSGRTSNDNPDFKWLNEAFTKNK